MRPSRIAMLVLVVATLGLTACSSPDSTRFVQPSGGPGASPGATPGEPAMVGWPDLTNTGVPAGRALKPSGSLTINKAGTVVDGLRIIGCVDVKASDVVIRNSVIRCDRATYALRTFDNARNLRVEHTEIDGGGLSAAAVCCGNYTLSHVYVHNTVDGPRLGDNSVIEYSLVIGLTRKDGHHGDTMQVTGAENIVVRHNRLDAYNSADLDFNNSAIQLGSTTGPAVRNMRVEGNLFNGGNYTINFRPDIVAENVVFTGNKFGPNCQFGPVLRPDVAGVTWAADNVWEASGKPVRLTTKTKAEYGCAG